MSDEDRLRERLRAQATEVPVVADLDDVAARIARQGRNRARPLVAVAVVTLVVGAIGGFALGRARSGTPRSLTVAGAGSPSDVPETTVPDTVPTGVEPPGPTGRSGGTGPLTTDGGSIPADGPLVPGAGSISVSPATREALVQAWDQAFDGGNSDQAHADAIEGGSGLVGVFHEIRNGQYGQQVAQAKTVVDNIVFHSPTSATVFYHADLGTGGTSGPYSGEAVLTPDGWKATHASYCKVASLAGVRCV